MRRPSALFLCLELDFLVCQCLIFDVILDLIVQVFDEMFIEEPMPLASPLRLPLSENDIAQVDTGAALLTIIIDRVHKTVWTAARNFMITTQ